MTFADLVKEIEATLEGGTIGLDDQQARAVGEFAIGLVIDRTKQGIDADHHAFAPYSPEYAETRKRRGRSDSTVDLALTGDMQNSMIAVPDGKGGVDVAFMSAAEEIKARAHTGGVKKTVPVKMHRRLALIDTKTGRRVTKKEAAKDKRRKKPRVAERIETVGVHDRNMNLPKRDFFDIRHPDDEAKVGEVVGDFFADNIKARRR